MSKTMFILKHYNYYEIFDEISLDYNTDTNSFIISVILGSATCATL